MLVIGILGKKRAGKTTCAEAIKQYFLPKSTAITGFADALKQEISEATGFSVKDIEERKTEFRTLLQVWGTDFRRNVCGNDYWIKKLLEKIHYLSDNLHCIVIPDVRFYNEAQVIKDLNGYLIRVMRPNIPTDHHQSETEQDLIATDYTIWNKDDLTELSHEVSKVIKEISKIR